MPLSWAIRPGEGEAIWSTETHCPGAVAILMRASGVSEDGLVRHGRLVALP